MNCIVMEIKNRKAVLLSENGSFYTVRDKGYRVGQRVSYRPTGAVRYAAAAAACAAALSIFCTGGYRLYYTPVEYMSVDVGSGIRLEINRFDRVINATAVSEEENNLLRSIDIKNKKPEETAALIVSSYENEHPKPESGKAKEHELPPAAEITEKPKETPYIYKTETKKQYNASADKKVVNPQPSAAQPPQPERTAIENIAAPSKPAWHISPRPSAEQIKPEPEKRPEQIPEVYPERTEKPEQGSGNAQPSAPATAEPKPEITEQPEATKKPEHNEPAAKPEPEKDPVTTAKPQQTNRPVEPDKNTGGGGSSHGSGNDNNSGSVIVKPDNPTNAKPEATKPDNSKPDNIKPDNIKPDNTKPDNTKPDNTKPDSTKPDNTKPDNTKPDNTKPDSAKPDSSKTDNSKPQGVKPDNEKPNNSNNSKSENPPKSEQHSEKSAGTGDSKPQRPGAHSDQSKSPV